MPEGFRIKKRKCQNKSLLAKRPWAIQLDLVEKWVVTLKNKYQFNLNSLRRRSKANSICEKGMG